MDDMALIKTVARIWVDNGGDSIGFDFCSQAIRDQIFVMESQQKTADPDADGPTKQANIAGEPGEVKE